MRAGLLAMAVGCAGPAAAPDAGIGDTGVARLEVGGIEGTLTRSAPLAGDGLGNLFIGVFYTDGLETDAVIHATWAVAQVDLRDDDVAIPFGFANLFPDRAPLYIGAVFDEDEDLYPDTDACQYCDGDLATVHITEEALQPVRIESGVVQPLALDLAVEAHRDWPAGSGGAHSLDGTGEGGLKGTLSRTASGSGDHVGDVYIMLFEEDPLTTSATPLFVEVLPQIDLSDPDTVLDYEVTGCPTSDAPLVLVAFLDDDGTGNTPGPGDLVDADGFVLPEVTLQDGVITEHDIVLRVSPPG